MPAAVPGEQKPDDWDPPVDPQAEPKPVRNDIDPKDVPKELHTDLHWTPPVSSGRTRSGKVTTDSATTSTAMIVVPGPSTYKEAASSPDSEHWMEAIASEIASIGQHEVPYSLA